MANAVFQSPSITTQAAKVTALLKFSELLEHLAQAPTYSGISYVQSDFGITAANKLTITLTGPPPDQAQIDRFLPMTRIA